MYEEDCWIYDHTQQLMNLRQNGSNAFETIIKKFGVML